MMLGGGVALVVLILIAFSFNGSSSSSSQTVSSDDENTEIVYVPSPQSTPQKAPTTNSAREVSFPTVFLYLKQQNFDAAKRELQKAIGAPQGSEAAQIEMAAKCYINFYESVVSDLKRIVPPQELCKGEYCVVESNPPKRIIIKAAGQSLRFSLDAPESHGQNLFEIFYRHRKMKVEGTGNMQPDLGYAAYLLFTESEDQATARKLLDNVQANGSPRDRETVQALKTLFNIQ